MNDDTRFYLKAFGGLFVISLMIVVIVILCVYSIPESRAGDKMVQISVLDVESVKTPDGHIYTKTEMKGEMMGAWSLFGGGVGGYVYSHSDQVFSYAITINHSTYFQTKVYSDVKVVLVNETDPNCMKLRIEERYEYTESTANNYQEGENPDGWTKRSESVYLYIPITEINL